MRNLVIFRLGALGGALLVTLAACSGEGGDPLGTGGTVKVAAAKVMAKVSNRVGKADTYRQRMVNEGDVSVGGDKVRTRIEMDVRVRLSPSFAMAGTIRQKHASMGGSGLPDQSGAPTKVIMIGPNVYMRVGSSELTDGKPWMKLTLGGDLAGQGTDMLGRAGDEGPAEQARRLTGAKDVREVGQETVAGVRTTRYAGTVSSGGGDSAQIELWVGADSLPRKQVTRSTMKSLGGSFLSTSYFSEYGEPLNISPPPAGQVGDFDVPKIPG